MLAPAPAACWIFAKALARGKVVGNESDRAAFRLLARISRNPSVSPARGP
jgi:hypothetical protein